MFSDVGKITWNSIKLNSMQMNMCTNYACGVAWSPKFVTCAKSSVLLCQFLLLNPIYASFSNNPFSVDNLFVGTDSTSWIWLRLSLIRFSTFQKYTFAKSTFCRIQKRFEMISTFVPCSQENVIQNKLLRFFRHN